MNHGTLCNIKAMVELKKKYKLRLFIDETVSFGTLGQCGKGITEMMDVSVDDIDLIMGSLETSIGSIGGFCAGTTYVVEHQTLAGLGYCFSASLPPMLAAGALTALEIMEKDPDMFERIRTRARVITDELSDLPGLRLDGDPISVVKHLRMREPHEKRADDRRDLNQVVQMVSKHMSLK